MQTGPFQPDLDRRELEGEVLFLLLLLSPTESSSYTTEQAHFETAVSWTYRGLAGCRLGSWTGFLYV